MMASHEALHTLLEGVSRLLNCAAEEIRDLPLEPTKEHVERIGNVLGEIFEIQQQIYAARPDLTPSYLQDKSLEPQASRRLTKVLGEAFLKEEAKELEDAISILKHYLSIETSKLHRDVALSEINRLLGESSDAS